MKTAGGEQRPWLHRVSGKPQSEEWCGKPVGLHGPLLCGCSHGRSPQGSSIGKAVLPALSSDERCHDYPSRSVLMSRGPTRRGEYRTASLAPCPIRWLTSDQIRQKVPSPHHRKVFGGPRLRNMAGAAAKSAARSIFQTGQGPGAATIVSPEWAFPFPTPRCVFGQCRNRIWPPRRSSERKREEQKTHQKTGP